jgi:DNA-binding HxlR family transcriptional regulator
MTIPFDLQVHEPALLRAMIQIHEWEDCQLSALKTISGRYLYFRIAACHLQGSKALQHLKVFQGGVTERAMRQRMREFEAMGLIQIEDSESDQRTKRVIPTAKFLLHLNQHLEFLKQILGQNYLMIDKHD